jgi:Uma2 family endonuclease
MSTAELRHRWTRAEWSRLDPLAYEHCELIDGDILDMAAMASPHALVTEHTRDVFSNALAATTLCCGSQTPVILDDYSEPEPDVWVASVPRLELELGKPQPHELMLVVEVGDTSVRADRRVKLPVYAAAGIGEVWMIDVTANTIDILTEPDPAERRYRSARTLAVGDTVATPWGAEFAVDDLLLTQRRF